MSSWTADYWTMKGVRRAHGELNIEQWRVLGELTRVEYWPMDHIG